MANWGDQWDDFEFRDYDDITDGDEFTLAYRHPNRSKAGTGMMIYADDTGVSTDKAVMYRLRSGEEVWFPRSQVLGMAKDCICISQWLADRKGYKEHLINAHPEQKEDRESLFCDDDDIPF